MNNNSNTNDGTGPAAFTVENQGKQKLWKSEFTIEIPTGNSNNFAGTFKILALLCYSTGTFEIVPMKDTDPILGHVSEYPKGDDTGGWHKYLFDCKRVRKYNREFDTVHVVINASQRLAGMKRNQRVWDTLKKEGVYIRARAFTNFHAKTAIGWFSGINPAMSGKETITKAIKNTLESQANIVDTEIVIESTRISQFTKHSKKVLHTEAWMLYGNKQYVDEIEECIHRYLSRDPHEVALGLRHCQFVPASPAKTEMPIKALRIQEQNKLLYSMASVEINNVYYNDDIPFQPEIENLFDHYIDGDRDGLSVTFRELLDEQLQYFTDVHEDDENMETEEIMDQVGGVYDIYFHRGNMHISCHKDYATLVVRGMRGVLTYLEEHLTDQQLAEFCKIRRLGAWNRPKVGAIHAYSDSGIKRTTVDVYRPSDIDPISLSTFMEQENLQHNHQEKPFVPVTFDGPPKALYHGRKRAPVQTERAQTKDGAADFWSKIDLVNQTPKVSDVMKQLARKEKRQTKQRSTVTQDTEVPHSIAPTSQTSTATTLTQMTEIHTKLKEQKLEFQNMMTEMAAAHAETMKKSNERINNLEKNLNQFKEEQAETMQEFHDSQGTMMTGITSINNNMEKANTSNATQLDFLASEVTDMRDGQKDLRTALYQILERLPEIKRKGTLARKMRINNTQLLNTLSDGPADVSMEDGDLEGFATQDPNNRGPVGSQGC